MFGVAIGSAPTGDTGTATPSTGTRVAPRLHAPSSPLAAHPAGGSRRLGFCGRRGAALTPFILMNLALFSLGGLGMGAVRFASQKTSLRSACEAAAMAGAAALARPAEGPAHDVAAMLYLANITEGTTLPRGAVGAAPGARTYRIGGDSVTVTTPYRNPDTVSRGWAPGNVVEVRATRDLVASFAFPSRLPRFYVTSRAVAVGVGGHAADCTSAARTRLRLRPPAP